MKPVFLDTVGLLTLWNVADQWHAGAEAAYARISAKRQPVITTTFVMAECGNAAARRLYRPAACRLRRTLEQRAELVVPNDDDWKEAWQNYEQGNLSQAGIVDQISFVVMRRLGLSEAFTNDRHFQAAGFLVLF